MEKDILRFDKLSQKVANDGITMWVGEERRIYNSTKELLKEFNEINRKHIYKIKSEVVDWLFKAITIRVELLRKEEINKPLKAVKLARNINEMDTNYHRIDDGKQWRFYRDLETAIRKHLATLSQQEKKALVKLVKEDKIKYFKL